jgi:hypothetical protein
MSTDQPVTPSPSPPSSESKPTTRQGSGYSARKFITHSAIAGLIVGAVAVFAAYFAATKAVERANQRVADLMGQIAVAEDKAKQLDARFEKIQDLVTRIERADPAKVRLVLDSMENYFAPGQLMKILDRCDDQEQKTNILARQVGDIYFTAIWATGMEEELSRKDAKKPRVISNLFRNGLVCLAMPTVHELHDQKKTGKVVGPWLSKDEYKFADAMGITVTMLQEGPGEGVLLPPELQQSILSPPPRVVQSQNNPSQPKRMYD